MEILKTFTLLKEYGSNVQKLADHIATMQDPAKRTLYAHILVELMRQIHPNMRDNQDYYNKLWDDLYIMSDFELDVESPYPPPSKELLGKKPLTVGYNQHRLNYHHYGRNIELLVEKAIETEDADDRLAFVSYLYRLMRSFYNAWNRDNPEDVVLLEHLVELSDGKLKAEVDYIRQHGPVEASPKDRNSSSDRGRTPNVVGYKAQTNFNNDRSKNVSNSGGSNSSGRSRHSNKHSGRSNSNNNRNRRK